MHPHTHFIGGALLGGIFYRLGLVHAYDLLIIGVIAVLIDLDHYIYYVHRTGEINPFRFWNHANDMGYVSRNIGMRSFIHHYNGMAVVFPLLLVVTMLDLKLGIILLSAYVSHMVLDHLRYFHIKIAPYRQEKLFGLKFLWNGSEEILFIVLTLMNFMIIF